LKIKACVVAIGDLQTRFIESQVGELGGILLLPFLLLQTEKGVARKAKQHNSEFRDGEFE